MIPPRKPLGLAPPAPEPKAPADRGVTEALAKDFALRLGGALQSRRMLGEGHKNLARTVEGLEQALTTLRGASGGGEITLGVVEAGLVVAGVMLPEAEAAFGKIAATLRQREVEIVAFRPECRRSDLDGLVEFLSLDAARVAGESGADWLSSRGLSGLSVRHLVLSDRKRTTTFRDVFKSGAEVVGTVYQRASEGGTLDALALRDVARGLLDLLVGGDVPVSTLVALREKDNYAFIHSINVSVLVSCQATALGLNATEVEEAGLAALVHDLGKTRLPDALVRRHAALPPADQQKLDRHTSLGARLLGQIQGFTALAPLVALEHHDPWDPQKPAHLVSQLTAIADAYDVLRTARPMDPKAGADAWYAFLATREQRFHPRLLGRFGRLLGAFPAGALVKLTTGEICRITQEGVDDPLRPAVEVVDTALGTHAAGTQLNLATGTARIAPVLPAALSQLTREELAGYG